MRLEINYRNKTGKKYKYVKAKLMLLNNYWVNEEIAGDMKSYLKTNANTAYQNL